MTKQLVDWCLEQNVKRFIIGDVEGVQRNKKKKRSKLVNQKLSNWCFGKFYDYLKYKLEAKGITFEKVDESYTTQTCPVCKKKKKFLLEILFVLAVIANIGTFIPYAIFSPNTYMENSNL